MSPKFAHAHYGIAASNIEALAELVCETPADEMLEADNLYLVAETLRQIATRFELLADNMLEPRSQDNNLHTLRRVS